MNWSWWSFAVGIVAAFLVSTGCLVVWWLIVIMRSGKSRQQVVRDYERAHKEILN